MPCRAWMFRNLELQSARGQSKYGTSFTEAAALDGPRSGCYCQADPRSSFLFDACKATASMSHTHSKYGTPCAYELTLRRAASYHAENHRPECSHALRPIAQPHPVGPCATPAARPERRQQMPDAKAAAMRAAPAPGMMASGRPHPHFDVGVPRTGFVGIDAGPRSILPCTDDFERCRGFLISRNPGTAHPAVARTDAKAVV